MLEIGTLGSVSEDWKRDYGRRTEARRESVGVATARTRPACRPSALCMAIPRLQASRLSVLQFDDDAGDAVLEEDAPWDSYDQLTAWEQR